MRIVEGEEVVYILCGDVIHGLHGTSHLGGSQYPGAALHVVQRHRVECVERSPDIVLQGCVPVHPQEIHVLLACVFEMHAQSVQEGDNGELSFLLACLSERIGICRFFTCLVCLSFAD